MSAAWQPEMDHLRRRVEELEKMLCQGHPAGVVCGVCRPEPGDKEWIDAAKRWRDAFHDLNSAPEPDPEPQSYVESLESRIKVALALCEAWDDNAADAIEAALRGESA